MGKRKGGRPSPYRPEYAVQAEKLCRLGATVFELADFFGVDDSTVWRWHSAHPEFREAIKLGREPADERVERSMYQKAVGYTCHAVELFKLKEMTVISEKDTGKELHRTFREIIHHERYTKHYPPDTTSCIFWLVNRKPDEWRHVKTVEHDIGRRLADLSEQQLNARLAELLGKAGAARVIDGEAKALEPAQASDVLP